MAGLIKSFVNRKANGNRLTFHCRHAMLAVGYSDHSQAFIVRNSWGTDWVNRIFFLKICLYLSLFEG